MSTYRINLYWYNLLSFIQRQVSKKFLLRLVWNEQDALFAFNQLAQGMANGPPYFPVAQHFSRQPQWFCLPTNHAGIFYTVLFVFGHELSLPSHCIQPEPFVANTPLWRQSEDANLFFWHESCPSLQWPLRLHPAQSQLPGLILFSRNWSHNPVHCRNCEPLFPRKPLFSISQWTSSRIWGTFCTSSSITG